MHNNSSNNSNINNFNKVEIIKDNRHNKLPILNKTLIKIKLQVSNNNNHFINNKISKRSSVPLVKKIYDKETN